ncbi:BglG family transcription antiterminator [Paramaledivibacter caminithermalis]|uniref:Transcriptional antiterminator n=1 Tax=Paramaledivibacter caminithermalis (strain DSM 15212 / CIP 107654 / DViRD3) TaxID=1121301 RepID=A0A1M6K9T5_PARC5|nr:BglG family transcription antiterminator [Paramaledivibacter caminithermalis]SHJ55768.1 Transcriptional antiterminator [Paramaledivibacter caminithermalis DSM 15212]
MDRVKEITSILLKSKNPITINQIASILKVSNKTIRNDLKKLQDFVEKEGLRLNKKTGVGTSIEGPEENKIQLFQAINKDSHYIEPYSRKGRHNYILKRLFMHSGSLTTKELADELYVCTTTIHKDLKTIEKWIAPFNLKLIKKRNYGIEIVGDEDDYRKAISYLISEVKNVEELQELLYSEYKGRIDYKTLAQLKSLFNIDYKKIEDLLNKVETKLKFRFSQEAYISLIIHIAISMKRIKDNKDIILSKEILESIIDLEEFKCAQEMSTQMEKIFGITIPKSEIGYITLHILGSKIHQKDLENLNFYFEDIGDLELAVEIAQQIIDLASDALSIDLRKDKALLNGLVLHLRPTINRLKYEMTLRNPILDEIKSNYPDIFGVAWMCSRVFEKYLDVKIPESEIGYIAIHLGAAVERNRKQIRTLVVCHSGIGTSQLLSVRLKRCFKEIEIIGIVSSTELTKDMLDNTELIISTTPLQIDRPVLVISPLFTKTDIRKVDKYIYEVNKKYAYMGLEEKRVEKEIFYRSKKFKHPNQIIIEMCENLEKKQYVKREFMESTLAREKIMATEVGNGIAIPHGDPKEVIKSCIALTILENPLKWKKEMVKYVFLICIAEKDVAKTKTIFRNLYRSMDKPEFLNGLKKNRKFVKRMLDQLEANF